MRDYRNAMLVWRCATIILATWAFSGCAPTPDEAKALLKKTAYISQNADGTWDVEVYGVFAGLKPSNRVRAGIPDPDSIIAALNSLKHIRKLTGEVTLMDAAQFRKLTCLDDMVEIDMGSSGFDDSILPQFDRMRKLEILKLGRFVNGNWIKALATHQELRRLDTRVPDGADPAVLAMLPHLSDLSIGATDKMIGWLPPLLHLNTLVINGQIQDGCLESLARHPELRNLSLMNTHVHLRGDVLLSGITKLESLDLNQVHVDDSAMPAILACGSLQDLNLRLTKVTDVGLKKLHLMPALRRLNLEGIRTPDKAETLRDLAKCPLLEELTIDYLRDADLKEFALFPKLRVVTFDGQTPQSLTEAAVRELHDNCPRLAIQAYVHHQKLDLPAKTP